MQPERAIVRRLVRRGAARCGSLGRLATVLGVQFLDVAGYVTGVALPPGDVLSKLLELVKEDLPQIRSEFPPAAWASLLKLTAPP
jgi:hypothetical protein